MLMETQNRDGRYIYKFSENPREDLGEINENIKSTYLWEVTFFPPPRPHFYCFQFLCNQLIRYFFQVENIKSVSISENPRLGRRGTKEGFIS